MLDCAGLVLTPGLVDLHTHLREPGFEYKETIASGTRAAAAGGFTAVSSMANTDPVTDHAGIVAEIRDKAAETGAADVFPVGAITKGLAGESMAELGEMVEAGVRVFSDDGNCVPTARMLRNALVYAKAFPAEVVIADHCEDASLVEGGHMHEGVHSYSLGLAGRPAEAEEIIVARDLAIARATGGRIHICHVSSAAVGRAAPPGQGRRGAGHRRSHAAPSGLHRRRPRGLRHELQGAPTAAHGRGP